MVSPSGRSLRGSHQLAAFEVCERLGDLRYLRRYSSIKDKPFRLRGTLIHLALAYHYASRMPEAERPHWFAEKDLFTALDEKGRGLPDGIQRAKEVLFAYLQEYPQDPFVPKFIEDEFFAKVKDIDSTIDADIQTLVLKLAGSSERDRLKIEAQLTHLRYLKTFDDEVVSCRPDLIALSKDVQGSPELWVVDYKTKGKSWGNNKGLEKWKDDGEFALNWQVLCNLHIVRAQVNAHRLAGVPVRGFVIQRMTREPDKEGFYYFDRHILTIPRVAYERTPRAIRSAVAKEHEVRRMTEQGIMPQPSYWACYGRYGPCDYRDVCMASTVDKARDILAKDFMVEPERDEIEEE